MKLLATMLLALSATLTVPNSVAESPPGADELNSPEYWQRYFSTPKSRPADDVDADILRRAKEQGVEAIFFEGPQYNGKPTRVFAFYGVPEVSKRDASGRVPGILLIHGGGGTAFETWVKLWVDRGYAAIALDTCGAVPKGQNPDSPFGNVWERLPAGEGGPPGWGGLWQVATGEEDPRDNWMHQATAASVLAHSWLLAQPEVDPERTGVTGVSWGGVLTCRVAGADPRFKFAAPVYGCGLLDEPSLVSEELAAKGDLGKLWTALYDPSHLLRRAQMPFLWINGTNDATFPISIWLKSTRLTKGPSTLSMPLRMPHAHGGPGENPAEIFAFAQSVMQGQTPLPKAGSVTAEAGVAKVAWQAEVPIAKVELVFTRDSKNGQPGPTWLWEAQSVQFAPGSTSAEITIPEGAMQWFFNLTDERGLMVSAFE